MLIDLRSLGEACTDKDLSIHPYRPTHLRRAIFIFEYTQRRQYEQNLLIPSGYEPNLDVKQTEKAIKLVKDFFEVNLAAELRLSRVTAPLFVLSGTGINDDLNGVETPVSFPITDMNGQTAEIVQSLAKWKRMMLADYGIQHGYGLYTDMNAIRPSEHLDNLHSLYVDQWDWERVISSGERTIPFLQEVVRKIYAVIKRHRISPLRSITHSSSLSCRMRSPSSTQRTCSENIPA